MVTYKNLLFTGPEAMCLVDYELNIKQHNQLLNLLLGQRQQSLVGLPLTDILYDDTLIRRLLTSIDENQLCQGECLLKTTLNLPLMVKFRAGIIFDDDINEKNYILVFGETEELKQAGYAKKNRALKSLLNSVLTGDMNPESILLESARAFDRNAEVIILPISFDDRRINIDDDRFLLSPKANESAHLAISKKTAVFCHDEALWCFFMIFSHHEAHGIACIKFNTPYLHDETDEVIFSLVGMILGAYIDDRISYTHCSSLRSLFQTTFDNIDQAIIVVNQKGIISICNSEAQSLYGYTALDLVGNLFEELVLPADSSDKYKDMLEMVMKGGSIRNKEMTHIRSDWTMINVSVTVFPYKSDDGTIMGAVFIVDDIEEKKRLKDKIMQWEKLFVLGEFLSSVANELNNPLTSMIGYSQLLLQREDNTKIDSMASTIYEEAKRCGSVVRGLLDLAREDELQSGMTQVNEVINLAIELKKYQLRANNISVQLSLNENIPQTAVDSHDIECLFLHIINYAERRMLEYNDGGQIWIDTAFENGYIIIHFRDTGTCIFDDDITETLDPFSLPGKTDADFDIGLSASCQILQEIGGRLSIEYKISKGNIITVELPVIEDIACPADKSEEKGINSASVEVKRVLVVDDEPTITDLLTEVLQQMNYIVEVAGDGNEAMQKLDLGDYELIISDLKMPNGFTGDKLHKFIKRKDPELASRIIFMTGDMINPETRKFLQSTGNPYLEKPFLLENLLEILQKLTD